MIDIVTGLLANPEVYQLLTNVVISVVGIVLAKIVRDSTQRDKAKDAILAGANDLMPVVQAWKKINDGPDMLTPGQEVEAQSRAITRAQEIGASTGVNVMKILGPTIAKGILEQAVSKLRTPSPVTLQPGVAALLPDVPVTTEGQTNTNTTINITEDHVKEITRQVLEGLKDQLPKEANQ